MMITFTGDLFLGNSGITIHPQILSIINESELVASNFESVLANDRLKRRADKYSNLQYTNKSIENYHSLIRTNKLYSLANNHIHDLGVVGLADTTNNLSNIHGVSCFGVVSLSEVRKPHIVSLDKKRIAFLAVSTEEPEVNSILAQENAIGVLDYNDPSICGIIKSTKEVVDYVVVLPHWGLEYINYPAPMIRDKAKKWIECGADIVIGHHPHVIQGSEEYMGKMIYYSLGNYIFPEFYNKVGVLKKWQKENCHSMLLKVSFSDKISIKEVGLFYDTKKHELHPSIKSIEMLKEYSLILDNRTYNKKQYYGYYQEKLYRKLKHDLSIYQRFKKIVWAKRKNKSNLMYFCGRIKKKLF